MKKRIIKSKKNKSFIILGIVTVAIIVYGIFFNGHFVYFTTGVPSGNVMRAENENISEMAANIFLSDEKSLYEQVADDEVFTKSIGNVSIDDYLKSNVESRLSRIATLNLYAQKHGISLSHVKNNEIAIAANAYYQALTDEQKKAIGADVSKLEDLFRQYAIADEVADILYSKSDYEVSADEARVISVQYITADSKEKIEEASSKLSSGKNFSDVALEYNGNSDYTVEMKRGQFDKAFEDAAYALSSGQTSGIVESQGRFYIIKCSSDNEQAKTDANLVLLREQRKNEYFESQFAKFENNIFVEVNNGIWKKKSVQSATSLPVRFESFYEQYLK